MNEQIETSLNNNNNSDGFAAYLAKLFVAKKGYSLNSVPETKLLEEHCDYVLTFSDGYNFFITAIVDAEQNSIKHLGLNQEQLIEISKKCREKYSGSTGFNKYPVTIDIIEVRSQVLPEDIERLKKLKKRLGVNISTFAIDVSQKILAHGPSKLFSWSTGFIQNAIQQPRLTGPEIDAPTTLDIPELKTPVLTYAFIATLVFCFLLELLLPIQPTSGLFQIGTSTLNSLGALMYPLVVEQGEWFRLLSSSLLHADPIHLLMNCIALYMAGNFLENLVGKAWIVVIFFLSALGGALFSLALNPPNIVSVGASGAIMGFFSCLLLLSFHFPNGPARSRIQISAIQVLIPSLMPLFLSSNTKNIDYANHFGGALVGALLGAILIGFWDKASLKPTLLKASQILAVFVLLMVGGSVFQVFANYDKNSIARFLIPKKEFANAQSKLSSALSNIELEQQMQNTYAQLGVEMPKSMTASPLPNFDELIKKYPRDPRVYLFAATVASIAKNPSLAETQIRKALSEKEMLATQFEPQFKITLHITLADILVQQGRKEEAKEEVKPFCNTSNEEISKSLNELKLCEE